MVQEGFSVLLIYQGPVYSKRTIAKEKNSYKICQLSL